MGKTAYQIEMDYCKAIRQSDSLKMIARDLKTTANREFQDCIGAISGNWTGENANAFTRKCENLKGNMIKSADQLEKTANAIRQIAENTYKAEMGALETASIRIYR